MTQTVLRSTPKPIPVTDPRTARAEAESASPILLRLNQVSRTFANGTCGLHNINLQVHQGDFWFITGPSGSGKSTLLKLLSGQEQPDRGQVLFQGQDVGHLQGNRLARFRRQLGIVFQDYKLLERRTVAENVALVLRTQGVASSEIQRRLVPTLQLVGLEAKTRAFPLELSGGEQQRVSIARAIIGTPKLLLADEPTGNLDPENALQVLEILKELNACGMTVLVTTHDRKLIQSTDFPVLELERGRLRNF